MTQKFVKIKLNTKKYPWPDFKGTKNGKSRKICLLVTCLYLYCLQKNICIIDANICATQHFHMEA